MIQNAADLVDLIRRVYGSVTPPKPLHILLAASRARAGEDLSLVVQEAKTSKRYVEATRDAADPFQAVFGTPMPTVPDDAVVRARRSLAQLVIGNIAERVFERIYRATMGSTTEFRLEDDRTTRTDTDYRVLNGKRRPIFRMNIKFHGSLFRKAREMVNLDPEDCFALATYKIGGALQKQDQEHLPYLFVIVSVPDLRADAVGEQIPPDLVSLAALTSVLPKVQGKRAIEDRIVHVLSEDPTAFGWQDVWRGWEQRISEAKWNVISARRAVNLLKDHLFERVYALRVRAFAQNYRGAELDMHFSLSQDLTPIQTFLNTLRDDGLQGLVSRLERGTF